MNHETEHRSRSIKLLRDSVAQKIAAGEVIDRPFSVLREFLDNAIDSGADTIDVYIEGGGARSLRVVDNGCGMSRENLELCYLPHATSKIEEIEDLDRIDSMGFRGEALASIAACSRMEIRSCPEKGGAHTLRVENGNFLSLSPSKGKRGTAAQSSDLFYTIPARKHFLKSDKAELSACKKLFLEKAIPFPAITFRFFSDGEMKLYLPPSSQEERLIASYPGTFNQGLLHSIRGDESNFSFTALAAGPSLHRRDRRMIHLYVNRRKIEEFSLLQAITYGYGEYLPGGSFPICFLFLRVDPDRIDFNIHPAKREVRFRDLKTIHHAVSTRIRSYLENQFPGPLAYGESDAFDKSPSLYENTGSTSESWSREKSPFMPKEESKNPFPHAYSSSDPSSFYQVYKESKESKEEKKEFDSRAKMPEIDETFRYLGQVFGLFLAVEKDDHFYLIDQHAAHERILYDRYSRGAVKRQPLLIPREFEVDRESAELLRQEDEAISSLGIGLDITDKPDRVPDGRSEEVKVRLTALPESCAHLEKELIGLLETFQDSPGTLMETLFATLSCKAAVKEGEYLPPETAKKLVSETFQLDKQRCPHGRPVWFSISEKMLYQAVGRS